MGGTSKVFLFVGNGPYANRGCEAIVRSTVDMLSETNSGARFILSSFGNQPTIEDAENEPDKRISHRPHKDFWMPRFGADWWRFRVLHRTSPAWRDALPVRAQFMAAQEADCALEIGGDNYSLEYGRPLTHLHVDRAVKSAGVPLVLWGASIGPFTADLEFEGIMREHLGLFDLILARETETVSYLASIGIEEHVRLVADPAFTLTPRRPSCGDELLGFLERKPIGLNLSPLAGRYSNDGASWSAVAKACAESLVKADLGPVLLIPHATLAGDDDHAFLQAAAEEVGAGADQLMVVPPTLTAAECKWVISGLKAFVGARTHATIAALSSCVPTISVGYSMKARGINKDIFGHTDWVLPVGDMTPEALVERCRMLLGQHDSVRSHLTSTIPCVQERARSAGHYLAEVLQAR